MTDIDIRRYVDSIGGVWTLLAPVAWGDHFQTFGFRYGYLDPEPEAEDFDNPALLEYCRQWSGGPIVISAIGYTAKISKMNLIRHIEDKVNPKDPPFNHMGTSYPSTSIMFTYSPNWIKGSNL